MRWNRGGLDYQPRPQHIDFRHHVFVVYLAVDFLVLYFLFTGGG
ncbi:MAG TPA: hypothetical protein VJP78_08385 [Thermoleophilia bacterium]|nr:hypothetical protein [Thermoleophilia bacterium]